MYANWRYDAAQKALIQLATDKSADPLDRLSATDGIVYAVRFQVKGIRQDPQLFKALVSLATGQEKEEPVRSTASLALAPLYEFSRAPAANGQRPARAPQGGWEQWLQEITDKEMGALKSYEVCATAKASAESVDLFCKGGAALGYVGQAGKVDVVSAFQNTLKAAEQGYVPAQAAVAMLYADGRGTQQNYAEAGKWWLKAAEGGDLVAARHGWNLYGNGEGAERNPALRNQLAKVIGEPIQAPRAPRPPAPATTANPPSATSAGSNP